MIFNLIFNVSSQIKTILTFDFLINPFLISMSQSPSPKFALLSVSDKTGIVDFAKSLIKQNFTILSTGGTAQLLMQHNIPVTEVANHTGSPEILDGRVKTLNPKIHGGILACRHLIEHQKQLQEQNIQAIDLVVVNLYPFVQTIERLKAQGTLNYHDAVENIDIGGPTMLRSAAKNHRDVTVIVDANDYQMVIDELQESQQTSIQTRFALAKKVFAYTATYDAAISTFLEQLSAYPEDKEHEIIPTDELSVLGKRHYTQLTQKQVLRYGENPQQQASFYVESNAPQGTLAHYEQLQGKELSFNNIADSDAAWECVKSFNETACVIVKHANPCGVAIADTGLNAYLKAFATDTTSAFGGIIAFNQIVDEITAQEISKQFSEVIIAPDYTTQALEVFATKPNVRLLKIALPQKSEEIKEIKTSNQWDFKRVGGGLLVQTNDEAVLHELNSVTTLKPTEVQIQDLHFANTVAQFVKSNAIVFCKNGQTLGIGAGQMSRVDSAKIAKIKAENAGFSLQGCVAASDAFFPFRDGLDVLADAGACAVVQPGGSMRDQEVIDAANERGVAMVITGKRHFRH
jgi:phosphoribosylaminoimidazolecarboxamide formyltransferase/IMP cyclohydrolase